VVEQPEVLKHDADPPAQRRKLVLGQRRNVAVEDRDQAAGRLERQEQQTQQRRLAGPDGPVRNWNECGSI
jgi:hypothetical protein